MPHSISLETFQSSLAPTEREHRRASPPSQPSSCFHPLSLHRSESTHHLRWLLRRGRVSILSRSNGARARATYRDALILSIVSILSRSNGARAPRCRPARQTSIWFQSSLAPTEREHGGGRTATPTTTCFNPLSLQRSESKIGRASCRER